MDSIRPVGGQPVTENAGSSDPPRDPDAVVAAALADEELMRQVRESLAAWRRGERGVPLKELQANERARRSA
jgi:hypothetical protein